MTAWTTIWYLRSCVAILIPRAFFRAELDCYADLETFMLRMTLLNLVDISDGPTQPGWGFAEVWG